MPKPPLKPQTLTLWDYPSQHYDEENASGKNYAGATPSYIIWELLSRYTKPGELVVDPMCGSGTTIDVAKDLGREVKGFDLNITRDEIVKSDARELPLKDKTADFVFIDPPYSTHIEYSNDKNCIGKLSALTDEYYLAMESVISEINRILKDERYMALYVSDSFEKDKPFMPIGFSLFNILTEVFYPVDIICVKRGNAKLKRNNWHRAAIEHNYFLRGFNYLFIMYKPSGKEKKQVVPDRRDINEKKIAVASFDVKKEIQNESNFKYRGRNKQR